MFFIIELIFALCSMGDKNAVYLTFILLHWMFVIMPIITSAIMSAIMSVIKELCDHLNNNL